MISSSRLISHSKARLLKPHLQRQNPTRAGYETLDLTKVRAGGLCLCSRDFQSPRLIATCGSYQCKKTHHKFVGVGLSHIIAKQELIFTKSAQLMLCLFSPTYLAPLAYCFFNQPLVISNQ